MSNKLTINLGAIGGKEGRKGKKLPPPSSGFYLFEAFYIFFFLKGGKKRNLWHRNDGRFDYDLQMWESRRVSEKFLKKKSPDVVLQTALFFFLAAPASATRCPWTSPWTSPQLPPPSAPPSAPPPRVPPPTRW